MILIPEPSFFLRFFLPARIFGRQPFDSQVFPVLTFEAKTKREKIFTLILSEVNNSF